MLTPKNKQLITNHKKLELAPPEHPDDIQDENPGREPSRVGVHDAMVSPTCYDFTCFILHGKH